MLVTGINVMIFCGGVYFFLWVLPGWNDYTTYSFNVYKSNLNPFWIFSSLGVKTVHGGLYLHSL